MGTEMCGAPANRDTLIIPLGHLLEGRGIGSKDSKGLKQGFNLARNAPDLLDRNDSFCEIVAQKTLTTPNAAARKLIDITNTIELV